MYRIPIGCLLHEISPVSDEKGNKRKRGVMFFCNELSEYYENGRLLVV